MKTIRKEGITMQVAEADLSSYKRAGYEVVEPETEKAEEPKTKTRK